jgi:hypothetical protein
MSLPTARAKTGSPELSTSLFLGRQSGTDTVSKAKIVYRCRSNT